VRQFWRSSFDLVRDHSNKTLLRETVELQDLRPDLVLGDPDILGDPLQQIVNLERNVAELVPLARQTVKDVPRHGKEFKAFACIGLSETQRGRRFKAKRDRAMVAAGANNIYGIWFGVDDPTPYQQQARAAAIKDAQDKAAQLAKAANVALGKVISISEGSAAPGPVLRAAAPMAVGAAEVPVETGELEIDVSVDVRFAVQ